MLQWPHRLTAPLGVNVNTSELELPEEKLSVAIVKAASLMNKELIGQSDPYVTLHVCLMFKMKTNIIDDNLNHEWNETFELFVEHRETQSVNLEVYDEDKRLGVGKLAVNNIQPETPTEITLYSMQSVDSLKIKDCRDRESLHLKVMYLPFTKDEQLEALELEKKAIEERKRLKEAGVIASTMDALDGAASLVFLCQWLHSALNVCLAKALDDAIDTLVVSISCVVGSRLFIWSTSSLEAHAEWGTTRISNNSKDYGYEFYCSQEFKLHYAKSKFLMCPSKYLLMPWDPGNVQNKVCASSIQSIGAVDLQIPWDPGIVTIHNAFVLYDQNCKMVQKLHATAWGQAMFFGGGIVMPCTLGDVGLGVMGHGLVIVGWQ
jgi:hypothetical protein